MSNYMEKAAGTMQACMLCHTNAAKQNIKKQQFAYRDGGKEVLLVADIPVWSCAACGEEYAAYGAEEAQHNAVCQYLGRFTPDEIVALRKSLGLTQAGLAEKTGIGIASIKRWENGTVVQNASMDMQLRALGHSAPAHSDYALRRAKRNSA